MKVFYILHDSDMGGSNISLLNLMSGMKNKGIEIVAVVPNIKDDFKEKLTSLGVNFYICPVVMSIIWPSWKNKSLRGKLGYIIRLIKAKYDSYKEFTKIVKKEHPDIIHTNVGVVHEGFFCAKKMGIPHVWHLREYQDKDFNWLIFPSKRLFKKLLRKSNVISITKDIHKTFCLPNDKKHKVIYNGILPKEKTLMVFPKDNYFLCASRVSKEKGHHDVVYAFAKFHKTFPNYKLIILGYGSESYIQELKTLSNDLGCADSVVFKGYTNDVIDFMKKAKALIVASYNEGFGRMTAEASFSGCLVIGRNTGGTKEILDETGGLRFNDNLGLYNCLLKTANMNEQEYKDIVSRAQNKAKETYSNENNVEDIYDFYRSIIKEK